MELVISVLYNGFIIIGIVMSLKVLFSVFDSLWILLFLDCSSASFMSSSFKNRYALEWPVAEKPEMEEIDFDSQVS